MPRQFEQLDEFILRARRAGRNSAQISDLLLKAGWNSEQIAPFLSDEELVPPPPPAARTTGLDVFFYLLSFFTLAISATSLGGIAFGVINRFFPDDVLSATFQPSQLHWSLAWFIVGAPVFFLVTRRLIRELPPSGVQVPGIRRVLTYLALFLASATIIGDVAALVYRFVSGNVTARFGLKVSVILALGGWILWYYWFNVRSGEQASVLTPRWHRAHAYSFVVVAVLAIVGGFMLGGTPATQRVGVRDQQRVMDLQSMYGDVQRYYDFEKKMPTAESIVTLYENGFPKDPSTGEPYEYVVGDGLKFTLCATFEASSLDIAEPSAPKTQYNPYGGSWSHPAGRHCFGLQVSPPVKP